MLMVDELEQTPLLSVHFRIWVPTGKLIIWLVGVDGETMVAVPEITDQLPVPGAGGFPIMVVLPVLMQIVWLAPAVAVPGPLSTCIDIVLELDAQLPLLAVQRSTFVPLAKPVTVLTGDNELVIVPLPEITDQVPMPALSVLAAKTVVGLPMQSVWFGPAIAVAGIWSTCILILEELVQPPLLTVHLKILVPVPNAVTVLAAKPGLVIVPVPETNDQVPIPEVGEVAANTVVGVLAQIVWLIPAVAVCAGLFTIIKTVAELEPHNPFDMVHRNVFVPDPRPVTALVGDKELLTDPAPPIKVQVPIPLVIVLAARVVVGLLIHKV